MVRNKKEGREEGRREEKGEMEWGKREKKQFTRPLRHPFSYVTFLKSSPVFSIKGPKTRDLEFPTEGPILALCCEHLGRIDRFLSKLSSHHSTPAMDSFLTKHNLPTVAHTSVLAEAVTRMAAASGERASTNREIGSSRENTPTTPKNNHDTVGKFGDRYSK